jgi:hypothetical protein
MSHVEHLYCRQVPAEVWNLMAGGLRMRAGEGRGPMVLTGPHHGHGGFEGVVLWLCGKEKLPQESVT